jgi:hypothetical protein
VKTGDISLIANNAANRYDTYPDHPSTAWPIVPRKPPPVQVPQSARRWVGGVGLLTGLGIMAIPGVGPV